VNTALGTNDINQRCSVCDHAITSHDRISRRYCDATQAQALTRKCICAGAAVQAKPADA
jgi:hypothetical protein